MHQLGIECVRGSKSQSAGTERGQCACCRDGADRRKVPLRAAARMFSTSRPPFDQFCEIQRPNLTKLDGPDRVGAIQGPL